MTRSPLAPPSTTANRQDDARTTRLLTAADVAARWQVPKTHVYRLARERGLPVVRLGKYMRFQLAAIEQWETAGGCSADG